MSIDNNNVSNKEDWVKQNGVAAANGLNGLNGLSGLNGLNGSLNGSLNSKSGGAINGRFSIPNGGGGGDPWRTEASKDHPCFPTAAPSAAPAATATRQRLPWRQRGCYSLGHVFNDLCASMWFSYALIFFTHVLGFSSGNAGTLFLIGQVADAVSTPFVGLASDRQNNLRIFRYGRRKTWHAIGTVCVAVSFPFLFIKCLGCELSDRAWQMVYFSLFIVVFQFGWASVQVAHLSLIPDLSKTPGDRTELSAYRNAFTAISSICVYSVAWIILGGSSGDTINSTYEKSFMELALIMTGIGIVFSLAFHVGVTEPKLPPKIKLDPSAPAEIDGNAPGDPERPPGVVINGNGSGGGVYGKHNMTWRAWLKSLEFYKIGLLYMFTRLFCNLSQTYISFYLQDTLVLSADSIAYIPLVNYVSGFLASLVMKKMNKKIGRTISFVIGAVIALGFCFWVFFGSGPAYESYEIYGVAVLMGTGGNVMLVTCLGITADLIGDNVRTGAFVYGTMSFADKLSNGLVVAIVQNLNPAAKFYKDMLAFGCGAPALVALLIVLTVKKVDQKTPKPSLTDAAATPHVAADKYAQNEERF